jgi:hypothetical protein
MRTCPINSSLFLSWLRLIWMVGEALDVGGGDSDRAASYPEQMSHLRQTEKNSVRAHVFRFALELGHRSIRSGCLRGAELRHCA